MIDKIGSHLSDMESKEREKSTKFKIENMFKTNERRRLNSNKSHRNTLLNKESIYLCMIEVENSNNNLKTDTPGLKQNVMYSR